MRGLISTKLGVDIRLGASVHPWHFHCPRSNYMVNLCLRIFLKIWKKSKISKFSIFQIFWFPLSTNDCFPKWKENKMIFEHLFGLVLKASMRVLVFYFPPSKRGFIVLRWSVSEQQHFSFLCTTSSMIHNSVTVRGTRVTLLVVEATSILPKIYPFRRGYVPLSIE